MDPVSGNNAQGRSVHGVMSLHVDDLLMAGDSVFETKIMARIRKDFQVGSEDKTDCMFVGQRIQWKHDPKYGDYINVHQNVAIDELQEIHFEKDLKDDTELNPSMHTAYRSVLGQISWLQSRTQFHIGYQFSRCASKASSPTIGDVKAINKTVRTIKSIPLSMRLWPPKGKTRLVGYPDASYRNNDDKSSQRAHVIFLAQDRDLHKDLPNFRGSLVDYETHKITATTMSTTVAELHGLMRCFGTCLFIRGLWSDISGELADVHTRTDANNLVTTASTTHQPEQKETMHLIQMLRKESNSGQMHDLAHVRSEHCLADCLTKSSAKADELIKSVMTGTLPNVDVHPPFRTMLQNKAFLVEWLAYNTSHGSCVFTFLAGNISYEVHRFWHSPRWISIDEHIEDS